MSTFDRFAPFIRDYIYRQNWEGLRKMQEEAARIIFDTEDNLLVTSSTASGKTEAAFFPILSLMVEDPPKSFGVLYIAPLKSLINDQFERISELLDMTEIPVFHWHGDVANSHKQKALRNPCGILQITPESLESMLINRSNDIPRIFSDLRFIVIDELHALMGSDRGNQVICQIERVCRLIQKDVRRIGLSATIGDKENAARWLCGNSSRSVSFTVSSEERPKIRLGVEHFFIAGDEKIEDTLETEEVDTKGNEETQEIKPAKENEPQVITPKIDAGYEYAYDATYGRNCLVFSNSREETEYITATLRQIAEIRGDEDVFLIHHGNLSAPIREEAETKLKDKEKNYVACATVTLEQGIDIGSLERVVNIQSPNSVSAFLQRLGRSGRRGQPPEMSMIVREEKPQPNALLPMLIPFDLLRGIAIIQLYIEERFIEPQNVKKMPLSLLFHQTLSTLCQTGELTPAALAERVLTLSPFKHVSREVYRDLLLSMIKSDYIQTTDEKGLIVGLRGEKLTGNYKFYATFKDYDNFTVRCKSDEIGTIASVPPIGDRFALAGKVWEVEEVDFERKLVYVKNVKGKMEIEWPGEYGEVHTRIYERMKQVLIEDTVYPYLKSGARKRLSEARELARKTGLLEKSILCLGGYTYCMFPWLGTRSHRTMRRLIRYVAGEFKISGIEYESGYILFKMEKGTPRALAKRLLEVAESGLDTRELVFETEAPTFEKFDDYIPPSLLREAFAQDKLRLDELIRRLRDIVNHENLE